MARQAYIRRLNRSGHMPPHPDGERRIRKFFGTNANEASNKMNYNSESTPPPPEDSADADTTDYTPEEDATE